MAALVNKLRIDSIHIALRAASIKLIAMVNQMAAGLRPSISFTTHLIQTYITGKPSAFACTIERINNVSWKTH